MLRQRDACEVEHYACNSSDCKDRERINLGDHEDDERNPQRGRWTWGFLNTRASTIGAGTAEIQRNTIAERVLGLAR